MDSRNDIWSFENFKNYNIEEKKIVVLDLNFNLSTYGKIETIVISQIEILEFKNI